MLSHWKKIFLLGAAGSMILLGTAGIVLPLIPGFVLVIAGALLADKVYPDLKHHPRLLPLINRLKGFFARFKQ